MNKLIKINSTQTVILNDKEMILLIRMAVFPMIIITITLGLFVYYKDFNIYWGVILSIIPWMGLLFLTKVKINFENNSIEKTIVLLDYQVFSYYKIDNLNSYSLSNSIIVDGGDDLGPGATTYCLYITDKSDNKHVITKLRTQQQLNHLNEIIQKHVKFQ